MSPLVVTLDIPPNTPLLLNCTCVLLPHGVPPPVTSSHAPSFLTYCLPSFATSLLVARVHKPVIVVCACVPV